MNAHNIILCVNSKDVRGSKNALKYTGLCNYLIKNLCGGVLQTREFMFGKPNSSTQNKCSIAQGTIQCSFREELLKIPHAKLAAFTMNFLEVKSLWTPDKRSSLCSCSTIESFPKAIFTSSTDWQSNIKDSTPKLNLKQASPINCRTKKVRQIIVHSCTKLFSVFVLKQKLTAYFCLH